MKKDPEYEVAKKFDKSSLGGKSLLFDNNVGLFFIREEFEKFDCIVEAVASIEHCKECLPKNSVIKFSGIQLTVESKEELSNDILKRLENYGFQYQGAVVPFDNDSVWVSTLFYQDPNFWSSDFEEFLKTYYNFLKKKYSKRNRKNNG